MKPMIGITCNIDYKDDIGKVSHMGCAGQKWQFLADNYIVSVEKAGGLPVIIPICAGTMYRPLANGYVKAKTGNKTAAETYAGWYQSVYLPTPKTETVQEEGQG